jgi:hypothetical protein
MLIFLTPRPDDVVAAYDELNTPFLDLHVRRA